MKVITINISLLLSFIFNTAVLAQEALKKNERIVFLGDSITAAGARKGGYITLSSQAIAEAHPELNVKLIGAGIGGHKVPDCQKRLNKDV
ncbi:MAG TPA: G-D-S-L family lipolytic protein, partial [Verrucomicrobiales bacterium]|nr:G-D-S-L family lipolytic protein [Verrucomicrobiales bacterium]